MAYATSSANTAYASTQCVLFVVNISSIAAHTTYGGGAIYCGTKHFIDAYTNAARHDLVDTNVRVTSISPGAVKTEFSQVSLSKHLPLCFYHML